MNDDDDDDELWWLVMNSDDEWWSCWLVDDDEWWMMIAADELWWMTNHDERCWMMMHDAEWCRMMIDDDECWWMQMRWELFNDDERWWVTMNGDDEWWWRWKTMNDDVWSWMMMTCDMWMMICDDTHKTWWEAVGRKEPGNHFGTVAVLGRSQFVLRCDVRGYPLFHIARQRNELMEWVESNFGAALDAESGISCWQHCNGWEFCSSDIAIVSLFVKLSSSHHRITHHTTSFYTYIHMYLLYVHECSEMCF